MTSSKVFALTKNNQNLSCKNRFLFNLFRCTENFTFIFFIRPNSKKKRFYKFSGDFYWSLKTNFYFRFDEQ